MTTKNNLLLLLLTLTFSQLSAQDYCIPHRFVDNYYFKSRDIQIDKNIIYGQAINYKGKNQMLDLDIYSPKKMIDSLNKRPLIMLIHGGSSGDKSKMERYCPLFAQRGFVVANINRRMGKKKGSGYSEILVEAYRIVQDAHAALRFLSNHAQDYGIDTGAVFIGGVSAGALTSTGIAYMNQQDFDHQYPKVTGLLRRMDNSTNEISAKFTIRGVINMWGQIADTSFISKEEAIGIPMIIFHSTADSSLSPYEKAIELAKRYKNLGACYQLHTSTGTGHVEGISKYYIAEQTGCFLKSILCNSCQSFEIEVDNENFSCINTLAIDSSEYHISQISLDPSIIRQYAGIYKTKSEKIKIILEDDHLLISDEQTGFKAELYPESETDFFLRDDNIQFTFHRNKKGQVMGMTLFIDAKEINAKKIK
ncbi:MAG: prolyl oligopeptidase family serine peptidase [Bacteroidales bacterium]|nr:prolyl oligopeptidase family serine peptidase [Bacteroidales bacterium]